LALCFFSFSTSLKSGSSNKSSLSKERSALNLGKAASDSNSLSVVSKSLSLGVELAKYLSGTR
jgi:hypothetical protein